MLELGKKQTLRVLKKVDFGIYLSELPTDRKDDQVLLPKKQVPDGCEIGDALEVFLYKDSDDRMIATTSEPKIYLHEVKMLKVREMTRIGAFLDWGLEKDLLLPYHEQRGRVEKGIEVLVALYVDKSNRLCATMNVYPYLENRAPYQAGDVVTGRVYEMSRNFGIFIAIDDRYSALIPKQEAHGKFQAGEILTLRVTGVREDGRLKVSPNQKAYLQMGEDAEKIEAEVTAQGGSLPFDDKAAPELIDEVFGMSKAAFKRAVGRLMKEGRLKKEGGRLYLTEETSAKD
jgi:predicted RNA-binding protein (virulence factor B family)